MYGGSRQLAVARFAETEVRLAIEAAAAMLRAPTAFDLDDPAQRARQAVRVSETRRKATIPAIISTSSN
jgi:hypothetical protein